MKKAGLVIQLVDTRGVVRYTFPDDASVSMYKNRLVKDNKRNCFGY